MTFVFPLALVLGTLAGFFWLGWLSPRRARPSHDPQAMPSPVAQMDAAACSWLGALLGARIGFILPHWDYFAGRAVEMVQFWQGGLSWIGGAFGALAGLALFARLTRRSFWHLADRLAVPAFLLALGAWAGSLVVGSAYGPPVATPGLALPLPDLLGTVAARWPVQLVGAVLSLAAVILLDRLSLRGLKTGILGCASLAMLATIALVLAPLRADPLPLLAGIRLDLLGSAALLVLASAGLALRGLRR